MDYGQLILKPRRRIIVFVLPVGYLVRIMSTGIIQATEPQAIVIVAGILLLLRVCELGRALGPFVHWHIHRVQDGNGRDGPLDRDVGGAQASELDVAPRVQRPRRER